MVRRDLSWPREDGTGKDPVNNAATIFDRFRVQPFTCCIALSADSALAVVFAWPAIVTLRDFRVSCAASPRQPERATRAA